MLRAMEITSSMFVDGSADLEKGAPSEARLSRDALAVLQMVARGCSASEIGTARDLPMADVITQLRVTVDALGATTVREAIGVAMQRGLVF
jgi:DNA-binding NarL/FixJ family response regulator